MPVLPILWKVLNMDTVANTLTASTPSCFPTLIIILPPHRTRRDHAREIMPASRSRSLPFVEYSSLFSAPLRDFQAQLQLVDAYIVANDASGFGSGAPFGTVPLSNILCTYLAQSHIMP